MHGDNKGQRVLQILSKIIAENNVINKESNKQ